MVSLASCPRSPYVQILSNFSSSSGVVTFMNPASEVWTGWARADALGRSLGELIRLVKPNGDGTTEVPAALVVGDGQLR